MRLLSLADLQATTITLLILSIFICTPIIRGFDGRLSSGAALDTSDRTMRNEFPASIYANGFVVLGNHSLEVPSNYPSQTIFSKQRLNEMSGDFIGVFTTVNQCSYNGMIIIRELDVNEVESNSCAFHHVSRLIDIINTAVHDPEGPFDADYILTITWKDMGCIPGSQPLNTFTLVIVREEDKTYALFQYEDIQWTADHSTSSMPPEAGIFIHGIETPQLPRNNMLIEPSVWNEESNIAVSGEWLFPLYDGPINVDVAAQSAIRMRTEDFLEQSTRYCPNMVVHNPKPTPTVPGYYAPSSANTYSSSYPSASSETGNERSTSDYSSSYTMSRTAPPTYDGRSASVYIPTESSPMAYSQETSSFSRRSSPTILATMRETSDYPTTSYRSSYDYPTPASSEAMFQREFQTCDSSVCTDSISKCFIFGGQKCCICPSGYYGGGVEGCHSVNPKESRRIYLEGEMNIDLPGSSGQQPLTAQIFLDTEVRDGGTLMSQAGLHSSPQNFPTIHALKPVFNVLNTFLAIPKDKTGAPINGPAFSVFSITSGLASGFNFTFHINIGQNGRLTLRGSLKKLSSDENTFRGSLNIQVTSDGSFSPLSTSLVDSNGLIQSENQMDRSIEFEKTGAGRVQFNSQTFDLKTATGQPVSVQISGYGETDIREGACLLVDESPVKQGQKYAVILSSQGYCREDCREDYGCSLYCVDMPFFKDTTSASESSSSDAITKVSPESGICQLELDPGPCRSSIRRYGFHYMKGRCIEFTYGGCEGNGNNFGSMEECEAKCGSGVTDGYGSTETRDYGEKRVLVGAPFVDTPSIAPPEDARCSLMVAAMETKITSKESKTVNNVVNQPIHLIHAQMSGVEEMPTVREDIATAMKDTKEILILPVNQSPPSQIHAQMSGVEEMPTVREDIATATKDTKVILILHVNQSPPTQLKVETFVISRRWLVPATTTLDGSPSTVQQVDVRCFTTVDVKATQTTSKELRTVSNAVNPLTKRILVEMLDVAYTPIALGANAFVRRVTKATHVMNVRQILVVRSDVVTMLTASKEDASVTRGTAEMPTLNANGQGQTYLVVLLFSENLSEDVCNQPTNPGPCRASIQRYTFNRSLGRCEMFYYGGCNGNDNNFETMEDCQRRCEASVAKVSSLYLNARLSLSLECSNSEFALELHGFELAFVRASDMYVVYLNCQDPCTDVRCGYNAYCLRGYCYCNEGYEGDAFTECRPVSSSDRYHQQSVEDVCNLPMDSGPCHEPMLRYAYSPSSKRCQPFTYGGCQGNANNFETEEECKRRCESSGSTSSSGRRDQSGDICSLPKEAGPCYDYVLRYAYNPSTSRCEMFYYGGCEGNANNFERLEECQQRCRISSSSRFGVMLELNVESSTKKLIRAKVFNVATMRIVTTDAVNVRKATAAIHIVNASLRKEQSVPNVSLSDQGDPCQLPADVGPCRASIRRFAFNPSTRRCEIFIYGGCKGNANNFETQQECETRCMASLQSSRPIQTRPQENILELHASVCMTPLSFLNAVYLNCEDPCANIRCGYNAYCSDGYCYCNQGYEGDANRECRPITRDPCANVRCGRNAYCTSGYCYCNQGYEGDPNVECHAISSGELCNGNRCGENAACVNGQCRCNDGYYGDPFQYCQFIGGDLLSSNPRCRLPVDTGNCHNRLVKYGYDSRTGKCEQFYYTGCLGNENRFDTYEECERECGIVKAKDLCEGVRCGLRAKCVEGRCVCEPGFKGDPDDECRSEETDRCATVRCGYNARCQDGYCVCEPGHSGDPYRECRQYACSFPPPLPPPALCVFLSLCACMACSACYVQNVRFAFSPLACSVYSSRCVQPSVLTELVFAYLEPLEIHIKIAFQIIMMHAKVFDVATMLGVLMADVNVNPDMRAIPIMSVNLDDDGDDRCRGVVCGQNAQCIDGQCECLPGYEGDPKRECRTGENCRGQRCGENAYCRDEVCICETGYQGNPYSRCERISDPCDSVQCAPNAFCEGGYCRCNPGYSGDGFVNCYYQGKCANVQCGVNAHCTDGRCVCLPGHTGDPNRRCDPAVDQDTCNGRRCGRNAVCDRGVCRCKTGYEGDPFYGCTEIPQKPERCGNAYCHQNARCHNGVCFCEYGFVGDGITVCERIEEDLCKRVQCAENAECEAGLCQCKTGFKGDGFSECTAVEIDPDSCNGRYCGANAHCQDGQCLCVSGYAGDPYDICTRERPLPGCVSLLGPREITAMVSNVGQMPTARTVSVSVTKDSKVNLLLLASRSTITSKVTGFDELLKYDQAVAGFVPSLDICANLGLTPNQYDYCGHGDHPPPALVSAAVSMPIVRTENASAVGVMLEIPIKYVILIGGPRILPTSVATSSATPMQPAPKASAVAIMVSKAMAILTAGPKILRAYVIAEVCHPPWRVVPMANVACTYDRQIQHYRCICDTGYVGDGATACIPFTVANRSEPAQCRIPCHRFATCDEYDGRCHCRSGFIGNGYTYCDFDCNQCLAEARCVPESSQCACPPGYTGDGIRICRPTTSQSLFSLKIPKDSETIRIREGSGALALRCILSGDVRNIQARWLTPGDSGRTNEQVTEEGRELWLIIDQPSAEHSGLYVCQAARVSDTVNVIVEPGQQTQTKRLFLTSDNGILSVQNQGEPRVSAKIWHIAENNRHKRVAIVLDCKSDRLIYTSDLGHAIRFGNASTIRLNQPPTLVYQNDYAKFTWVAVDPASGNIFAIDEGQNRIIVVNPERPNQVHTLKKLPDRSSDVGFLAGGIAVHPGLSLIYWAQLEDSDSETRESVIKVASMADPEKVSELTRLDGAPIALNLAVTDDMAGSGSTAGRLCWLQRRHLEPYSRTEIYCAQLDSTGRSIQPKRLLKSFEANEEPSSGLIQDDYTIFWTNLYRKIYRSLNPTSSVFVKGVCCSNGFQSMAMYNTCKRSMTNACSYENGRCRYICLPGGREISRVCRCPDDQPNCVAEYA
ncbi:hypothetical protein Aperf_G00000094537 [Anoplocephala perfoliata]